VDRLTGSPPANILIVVLDCGRADDFPGGRRGVTNMPFADRLRRESLWFPRAVSPAPWTVPSHASLFTGMYPWEHGAHAKSALKLPEGVPRLPALLREHGYRTMSLSANHLISPDLGFTAGFDRAAWAGWWEPYYRVRGRGHPAHSLVGPEGTGTAGLNRLQHGPVWSVLKLSSRIVYRFPFFMDSASRLTQRIRDPRGPELPGISSWIEPTLDRWLAETPADKPVFTFVNLLETHEPYYPEATWGSDVSGWLRRGRMRQDHVGWLAGTWKPTAEQYRALHELSRENLAAADRRLATIAEVFARRGRWDDTTVVVTSDHGQAFGEADILFHMLRLEEPLVRVPLVVRSVRGPRSVGKSTGWASLIDVAPTVAEDAGLPHSFAGSGVPLGELRDRPRSSPVFAAADGLVWKTIIPEHERGRVSEQRKHAFDRILTAAWEGDLKVVYDATEDRVRAFDTEVDPSEQNDVWPARSPELAALAEDVRSVARRMAQHSGVVVSDDVEDRLRSWGYI
jgi:arylsulfatase A-like enzyme